jgi:hypothetical protein
VRRTAWGRVAGVVVAVVLVAGACGGDDDGGDASPEGGSQPAVTTTAPAPSTTPAPETTTTTADPLAVPAVIDAAYLDRVLAEIEHVVGDAGRMIQAAGAVTPEAEALLATVYSPEFLEIQIQGWEQVLADPAEVAALRQPIGDRVTTIAELFTATPECVFARVEQDFSPITSDPPDQGERYLLLFPVDATQDPSGTNPTSWRIQDRGVAPAGVEPGDPCVG